LLHNNLIICRQQNTSVKSVKKKILRKIWFLGLFHIFRPFNVDKQNPAGYPVSGLTGYPVSGRISVEIRIRCIPNFNPPLVQYAAAVPEPEVMSEEEIVVCLCGKVEGDGLMVQCDLCLTWQHGSCLNISTEEQVSERVFICYPRWVLLDPELGRRRIRFIIQYVF
jgi:hypothetical protein